MEDRDGMFALYLAWRRQRSTEADLDNRERALAHQVQVAELAEKDAESRRITDLYTNHRERVQEREVRLTAQKLITSHLRRGDSPDTASRFWPNLGIDLTNAVLINFSFVNCQTESAFFRSSAFVGPARFGKADFRFVAGFSFATFSDTASFEGTRFQANAMFRSVTFGDDATFRDATFGMSANYSRAAFAGRIDFTSAEFAIQPVFDEAEFRHSRPDGMAPDGVTGT